MTTILQTICPADFPGPTAWRAYVAKTFPLEQQEYALASGRTTMFLRFYEMRGEAFPAQFSAELERLEQLPYPAKTEALQGLNGRIFAHMIQLLSEAAPRGSGIVIEQTPREMVCELLEYMGRRNPWFARWVRYSAQVGNLNSACTWEEYVRREFDSAAEDEIQFALLMEQMGRILRFFRDRNLMLPDRYFQRIWLVHNFRKAERNSQARALVQGLVEAMESCTSA